MRHATLAFGLVALLGFLPSNAAAQERAYPVKIIWKFGRGLENILKSPVEIPVNMYKEAHRAEVRGDNAGGQAIGYFTGTLTGIGYTLARIGVGVFDVVTFPVPTDPIMHPSAPNGLFETIAMDSGIDAQPIRRERNALMPSADPPL
jgi:putative exosortase-associated protein (TIGR04073 family)